MRARRGSLVGLGVALAVMLVACGSDGPDQVDSVEWRNIEFDLPDGWYRFEETDTRLSVANQPIGTEADLEQLDEDDDTVAMFLTFEPDTQPDDWRTFAEQQDATIETDDQLILGEDIPATRLVFSYESDGSPTREMVVLIPSRRVVVLAQPVPGPGDEDAPEVFLEHLDTFMEMLDTFELGAPVLE